MPVAAIDCGTNSIRLLIADVDPRAMIVTDVVRETQITKLGQDVDRTGRFADAALERSLSVIKGYAQQIAEHSVPADKIRFVATSATRDAENRADFVGPVRDLLGVEPEVVPGTTEAKLSFLGAVSTLEPSDPRPALVVDLGGGSTELVVGSTVPTDAYSMNVGCVRLTERHGIGDLLSETQRQCVVDDVEHAIAEASNTVDLSSVGTVIGVAGTVTTITAHALRLPKYDRDAIDGARMSLAASRAAAMDLAWMPKGDRAALPYMHPGRVDVMPAGSIVWDTVLAAVERATAGTSHADPEVITSEHDILDGIALSLAATR